MDLTKYLPKSRGQHRLATCLYCGAEIVDPDSASGSRVQLDHVTVCVKHPIRKLEQDNAKLRKALIDLLGVHSMDEALTMLTTLNRAKDMSIPRANFKAALQVLIDTVDVIEPRTSGGRLSSGEAPRSSK